MYKRQDEQRAEKAALEGLVKQLFVELKRDFKPSDLPPYTLVTVSYTHLDVYKRQDSGNSGNHVP